MKRIIIAEHAGFCYGVRRAVDLAFEAARETRSVYMLGELIHSAPVLKELLRQGVRQTETIGEIERGATVILRAHGVSEAVERELRDAGLKIIDATCPCVKAIHRIVERAAGQNRFIVIIGSPDHPEIKGIVGRCRESAVFDGEEELERFLSTAPEETKNRITAVSQTTMNRSTWDKCVILLRKVCTNIDLFDTICDATNLRQKSAQTLATQADAVVVVGDAKSTNTAKLAQICGSACKKTLWIETANELDPAALKDCDTVALTAGASTPAWIIKEVMDKMSDEVKNTSEETTESFAEMLEQNFKTLHTGEKVIGVVTGVTNTEIQVDLGTKHAGFVPVSEFTDDPSAKLEDLVKVGDRIELSVVKVNDSEGTASLSKKRLDALRGREIIAQAWKDSTTLEGTVIEENRGGVVVLTLGTQVFVPASQSGIPRSGSLSDLMRKKVKLRIMDVNFDKRRVVGSIRAAQGDERRAAADKIWETIKVGDKFNGTVKSMTDYGVFVDIGGVDGMVHISELSWKHVKHPSEVVSVGDSIDVHVLRLDPEKHKISLGHRSEEDNPWNQFATSNKVGDVIKVKVLRFMPFGAFAEVLPGVDGLIHISQICNRRISRPAEVLSIGQEVDVKIVDIDFDKKKIGLSIRALTDPSFETDESAENESKSEDE